MNLTRRKHACASPQTPEPNFNDVQTVDKDEKLNLEHGVLGEDSDMEDRPACDNGSAMLLHMNWWHGYGIEDSVHACLLTYLFTWCVVPHGPGWASSGNVRSGMSCSHHDRIRLISHLAAWSIWFALRVR
jgi:hypothetical protein